MRRETAQSAPGSTSTRPHVAACGPGVRGALAQLKRTRRRDACMDRTKDSTEPRTTSCVGPPARRTPAWTRTASVSRLEIESFVPRRESRTPQLAVDDLTPSSMRALGNRRPQICSRRSSSSCGTPCVTTTDPARALECAITFFSTNDLASDEAPGQSRADATSLHAPLREHRGAAQATKAKQRPGTKKTDR